MASKEKGRRSDPIPMTVLPQEQAEYTSVQLRLQASRLTGRCAVTAAMAAILAPLVFGEVQP